jgi:hypothetical protein
MSRRYTPDHKALVLKILVANKGDITATSRFTGVPERTLRDWQIEIPPAAFSRIPATLANAPKRQPQASFPLRLSQIGGAPRASRRHKTP